ncbi:response regulator [Xanthobacter sp. TB0136]|uniref:response regulator n=1 Tax=Xanthobacter sp. TB0136 TaxID=3459177 RepID=UPI0040397BAD
MTGQALEPGAVLLVEDEPVVAMVARQVLEEYGFTVTVAPHGEAALSCARTAFSSVPEAFVLAMVDVGLPDMPGLVVVNSLRELAPALPIIIASGHARDELEEAFSAVPSLAFLGKPYDGAGLQHVLRGIGFAVRDLDD